MSIKKEDGGQNGGKRRSGRKKKKGKINGKKNGKEIKDALWTKIIKNPDVSAGPLARPFA